MSAAQIEELCKPQKVRLTDLEAAKRSEAHAKLFALVTGSK